jgi:hypothetical protein
MLRSFLLIRRGHGRDEKAAGLDDRERSILRIAADRVDHDINVLDYLLEPRTLHVNDSMCTECLNVRNIIRQRGGDHFTGSSPR